jgi:hypothetical protein
MSATLIRYKTRPESVEENQLLIEKVFEELHTNSPEGIRYLALRLADGTFLHFVIRAEEAANPILGMGAFRSFQKDIKARCIEAPQVGEATVIGNYRMLRD